MYVQIDVSAGGTFLDAGTPVRGLGGATLAAAAATSTLKVQEKDNGGRILAMLTAVANTADRYVPVEPIIFQGQLFVTVTGAAATALIELA